jgi:XTP/dITP diphosphohydrolase
MRYPETALERTNQKFLKRFRYIEDVAAKQGKALTDMTLGEMDAIWNEAKAL